MKQTLLILFILFFSVSGFSQSYKSIERAEREMMAGNYDKALRLLKRAEKQDYGFCGNAWIEAVQNIDSLKLAIYKQKGDKKQLKKFLDEVNPVNEVFDDYYSKERIILALENFTEEELRSTILNALYSYKQDTAYFETNIISLKLTRDYTLKLRIDVFKIMSLESDRKLSFNDALIEYFKQSEYYKML